MFQWARRASSPEPEEPACGFIEMKGSEPKPQAPRRHWRGIWPAWEEPKQPAAGVVSPPSPRSTRPHRQPVEPAVVRASSFTKALTPAYVSSVTPLAESTVETSEAVLTPLPESTCPSQEDAEFLEVKMVIRVPKMGQSVSDLQLNNQVEELREELERKHLECRKVMQALERRTRECEDLVKLVRELTESRSQLTAFKAMQTERFEDLQQEYTRMLRVAELSRTISKENLAKTAETTRKLNQVEEELARQRLITQQTKDRLARQKIDNLDLRERLNMLERLDMLAFRRDSACMVNFQQLNLKETY